MNEKSPFQKWLLNYLETFNLSNRAFARWIGINASLVGFYLHGMRSPTYHTLQLIINKTGVDPNVFFEE